jgi:AraC-like DNA-binding protein
MIWSIFSNLYFSIAFVAFIVFVDLLVKFENARDLKFYFLFLTFSVGMVGLINALFAIDYVFYVAVFKSGMVFSLLNILAILYFPKYKNWSFGLSIYIIGFSVLFMLLNNKFIPSNAFLDNFMVLSVDSHLNIKINPILRFIRLSNLFIVGVHMFYFWYVIYKKTNLNNIYFAKIRTWTSYMVALMVLILIANIAIGFSDNREFWANCLTIFILFSVILFVLKRPSFINKSAKKVAFGHKFNQEVDVEIDEIRFHLCFNEQRYYTKNEASLEDFAGVLNVKTSVLSQFVQDKFDLSFNDLINKLRVNYFFEIVQDEAYQNYTIDALAKLAGFNSRQHLNKPFKRFHGGNPSDLLTTTIVPN